MKLLFFGDIMGRPGRTAIKNILPELKKKYQPDLIIANGENLAHGKGITRKTLQEILDAGVEVLTSGNHIYRKSEGIEMLEQQPDLPVVRPANYPKGDPGKSYIIKQVRTKKVLITNINGRVFMQEDLDCPFRAIDQILKETKDQNPDIIIVDSHCEATSESRALGFYLDGKVSAVLGTHTHVQTADEQILPQGTAYITSAGMVGAKNSVLGIEKEKVIKHFLTQMPPKWEIEEKEPIEIDAVLIEFNEKNKAVSIERIQEEISN